MSVKQDALDELVTEQELLLMDMLKNWNDIRTRLANIEPKFDLDSTNLNVSRLGKNTKSYKELSYIIGKNETNL